MTTTNHTSPSGEDAANGAIGEREAHEWAPARIWLQREQGEGGSHTWCEDSVGDGDLIEEVEYVRAALIAEKVAGQEPVATLHDDGHYTWHGAKPYDFNYAGWRMKVYAAPQQPAQPVAQTQAPAGWFVQRSKFGPWVEVEQHEPGAEQFYRIAAQPVSGGKS